MHEADVVIAVERGGWRLAKTRYQDATGASGGVLDERNPDEQLPC
jgi:hypothetical protein